MSAHLHIPAPGAARTSAAAAPVAPPSPADAAAPVAPPLPAGAAAGGLEHSELVALAREIARRELAPAAGRIDAGDAAAIAACWATLCEVGLDRALLAEEQGGAAVGLFALLDAIEELAAGDGGLALAVLLSNAALVSLPPARVAEIPPGARWAAVPLGWGAQVTFEGERLQSVSAYGLGAQDADGILLAFGSGDRGERRCGCGALYLARGADGLQLIADEHQLGLRGAPAAAVHLVAGGGPDTVSAGIGGGEIDGPCLQALLRQGAVAIARGIARRAEELAHAYALERRQGGVPIIDHEAVSDMLGQMAVRRRCAPPRELGTLLRAEPRAGEAPSLPPIECEQAIAAKVAAGEAAIATSTDAVQVFGGTGYMRETGAEKLMRDAMSISLFPEPGWAALQEMMSRREPDRA